MAIRIDVDEAQAHLKELIDKLSPGEELVITENQRPVAKLVSEKAKPNQRLGPGLCKGMITIVADDDEHLEDFKGYMP
jgi:prevent-host-death family protein